jgi:signal transduction histidine kinase
MRTDRLKSRPLLILVPFVAIALLFALAYAATVVQVGVTQARNRLLLDDMLASIELIQRMDRDIDQMRLYTEEHIRSRDPAVMARLEAQIATLEEDRKAAANEFAPLATLPGEAARWEQLKESVGGFEASVRNIERPLRTTLALSRVNLDVEAGRSMQELDDRFAEISEQIAVIVNMNRSRAAETLDQVQALNRTAVRRVQNLAVAGIALSLLVGVLTARDLRRRQERLRRYSAALEVKNRELDAFAGRVAHDLRGPLNAVSLSTSRLARRSPEAQETTATLRRAVKRMDLLIDDLLSLSRLGAVDVNAMCDPATAAAQVRADLVPELHDTDVAVRVDVEPARVQCGESLLRQVLWNLLENSVKYRRPGVHTEVEVSGRPRPTHYELSVRDNGSGMSPEEARHAFDPLFRGERAREQPGTGLGLSIVKRVIDATGGTIAIDSRPGVGTTFSANLPLAQSPPARDAEFKTTP